MNTLAPSFLIGSSPFLQVSRTCIKAWMSSNFGKFATELLPLIDVRIEFLFNIFKTNRPSKTKFCKHIIYFGIVNHCFSQISNRSTALDWRQNLVFAQYLENELTKWDQSLYTHYQWQDLSWYCKSLFFRKFATELRPLINVRIWFLLNILRMNWQNKTKFCIHITDKINVSIVNRCFSQICNRVTTLDWFKN